MGLALCSLDDNPSKKDFEIKYSVPHPSGNPAYKMTVTEYFPGGQTIAEKRAKLASYSQKTSEPIFRDEALEVLNSVGDLQWSFKSQYNVLKPKNEIEAKLIAGMRD